MGLNKPTVDLTKEDEVRQFNLGELYIDETGNHYRYLQADGVTVANTVYNINLALWEIDAQIDVGVNPADAGSVACCVPLLTMTDDYFAWCFVGPGVVTLTTAAAVAVEVPIYGHATAGLVDDAATALLLRGLHAVSAIASATTGSFYAATGLYAVDLP